VISVSWNIKTNASARAGAFLRHSFRAYVTHRRIYRGLESRVARIVVASRPPSDTWSARRALSHRTIRSAINRERMGRAKRVNEHSSSSRASTLATLVRARVQQSRFASRYPYAANGNGGARISFCVVVCIDSTTSAFTSPVGARARVFQRGFFHGASLRAKYLAKYVWIRTIPLVHLARRARVSSKKGLSQRNVRFLMEIRQLRSRDRSMTPHHSVASLSSINASAFQSFDA